ncbi:hypothetical protein M8J77_021482 [Diaphorina citri]|nr:hypothetical protein M8J77_021482 [Diaphorina citri]
MRQNKLKIAPEKTEAALLIGRKKCQPFTIQVGDKEVSLSDNLKYLGIFLDRKLTFSKHISEVVTKADNRTKALSRIMPRTGGAGWTKRKLLYATSIRNPSLGRKHKNSQVQEPAGKIAKEIPNTCG